MCPLGAPSPKHTCAARDGSQDTCGQGYCALAPLWDCRGGAGPAALLLGAAPGNRAGGEAAGGGARPGPGGPRLRFDSALCPSLPLTCPHPQSSVSCLWHGRRGLASSQALRNTALLSASSLKPVPRGQGGGEEEESGASIGHRGGKGLGWSGAGTGGQGWGPGRVAPCGALPSRTSLLCAGLALPGTQTRFSQEPADQTVVAGQRAVLPCVLLNYSGIVQWTKDGLALGMGQGLKGEWVAHQPGTRTSCLCTLPQHRPLGPWPLPLRAPASPPPSL